MARWPSFTTAYEGIGDHCVYIPPPNGGPLPEPPFSEPGNDDVGSVKLFDKPVVIADAPAIADLTAYLQRKLFCVQRTAATGQSLMRQAEAWCAKQGIKNDSQISRICSKAINDAFFATAAELTLHDRLEIIDAQRQLHTVNSLARGEVHEHGLWCRFRRSRVIDALARRVLPARAFGFIPGHLQRGLQLPSA